MLGIWLAAALGLVPLPEGALTVDAYFDDWAEVPVMPLDRAVRGSLLGPDDLGGRVQIAVAGERVFFALQIQDDRFQPGTLANGDGAEILYRGPGGRSARFAVVLNELEPRPAEVRRGGAVLRTARVASTTRKDGWAVEISLPISELPGIREGEVGLVVAVRDADVGPGADAVFATGPLGGDGLPALSNLSMAAPEGVYDQYLQERGGGVVELARRKGNVAGDETPEEVVVNSADIVVTGRGLPDGAMFFYFTHGWGSGSTLKRFDLQELDGRPGKEILLERVEPGDGISVEILEVYGVEAGLLKRMFAVKLAEVFPSRKAEVRSRFKVLPPKGRGAARFEVTVAKAVNITDFDYPPEAPGQRSYHPLPLPWRETRSAIFAIEGDYWQRER